VPDILAEVKPDLMAAGENPLDHLGCSIISGCAAARDGT
jgi:hypothetical protein